MRLAGLSLLGAGAALMLLSSIGALRLPDVFSRLHAATKSASLGLACVLVGVAVLDPRPSVIVKVVLAITFQFATAPIAAHVVGRAAHRAGVSIWEGTRTDELAEDRRRLDGRRP